MALREGECELSEEAVPAENAVADDGIVVPYNINIKIALQ
jgi:hypothetical protein